MHDVSAEYNGDVTREMLANPRRRTSRYHSAIETLLVYDDDSPRAEDAASRENQLNFDENGPREEDVAMM